jgi:Polyketide cyclase / dehydrase and lipid transport
MEFKNFISTTLMTVLLSSIGFSLLHFNFVGYGSTFFLLVPVLIGYFLGIKPSWKISSIFALILGIVSFFYLLLSAQLEGWFCIITLAPLLIILIFVGIWIGYKIKRAMQGKKNENIQLTLYPLLILLFANVIEHYFSEKYDFGRVESSILLPCSPTKAYDFIKNVDTLNTEKPLLLHLGLATPQKCILEKEEVGAKRTCYFAEGTIEEKVTAIKSGEFLKMEVTRYGLPGRKWLKFQDAIYTFVADGEGTRITRVTTYRTELKPRFYWRFWEQKAIEAEHEYVLRDLERRVK